MLVRVKVIPLMILLLLFLARCEKGSYYAADGDGNLYDTVTIGTQVWLKDNLKTTKTTNGVSILLVTDSIEWSTMTRAAYCWYDNVPNNYKDTYGALYNWYAARLENLCPVGFHVPTAADWRVLIEYLGGEGSAGGKLKESGSVDWLEWNDGATNETGFKARPGGARFDDGSFDGLGYAGRWWTSSSRKDEKFAYDFRLEAYSNSARIGVVKKSNCYSIRCVQD